MTSLPRNLHEVAAGSAIWVSAGLAVLVERHLGVPAALLTLLGGVALSQVLLLLAQASNTDGWIPFFRHFWCVYGPVEYDTYERYQPDRPGYTEYVCDRCGQTVHWSQEAVVTDDGIEATTFDDGGEDR